MIHLRTLLVTAALAILPLSAVFSQNTATNPVAGGDWWRERHEGYVRRAQKGDVDILFLGDSITEGWRRSGSNVWARHFADRKAAAFGISGDRTQHLLWRLDHGGVDGLQPKVVIVLIGTNNTGKERNSDVPRNSTAEAIEGITAVVRLVHKKLPSSHILLLGLFPRGDRDDPQRAQVVEINRAVSRLNDGAKIHFLDIGEKFLSPDGQLLEGVMPDKLHLSEQGYEIWAQAIDPTVRQLMK